MKNKAQTKDDFWAEALINFAGYIGLFFIDGSISLFSIISLGLCWLVASAIPSTPFCLIAIGYASIFGALAAWIVSKTVHPELRNVTEFYICLFGALGFYLGVNFFRPDIDPIIAVISPWGFMAFFWAGCSAVINHKRKKRWG